MACDGSGTPLGERGRDDESRWEPTVVRPRTTDEYNYVWKTERAWRGTCRRLVVILKDGQIHYANVLLK